MSPENVNPSDDQSGDISEDELKKLLGDDYDSVVGKDEEVEAASSGESPQSGGAPAGAGASSSDDEEPVTPNMTDEEAEAWAKQMEAELETDATVAQAGPSSSSQSTPPPPPAPQSAPPRAAQVEQPTVQPVQFAQLEHGGGRQEGCIDVLLDVKLPISVELGRTEMLVKDILNCSPGTVIELNKLAGEPVDVLVNGRMVANGEVVVVDEHFGIRLTNLISPKDRVRSLA